jgi:hypothetical protein
MSDTDDRLAKARARKAAAEAARANAETQAASTAEIEQLEREAADAEAITDAICKLGAVGSEIAVVETDMGAIIVKRASSGNFRRFQDQAKFDTASIDKLVRPCFVYPDHATIDRILDRLPATLPRLGDAVVLLAGARASDQAAK